MNEPIQGTNEVEAILRSVLPGVTLSEPIYDNNGNVIVTAIPEAPNADGTSEPNTNKTGEPNTGQMLTVSYLLEQMEKIRTDSEHIRESVRAVMNIMPHPPAISGPDYASKAQAEAIGDIVKSREATNQKLLAMYERMYEDIKPANSGDGASATDRERMLKWASEMCAKNELFGQAFGAKFGKMFEEMFR